MPKAETRGASRSTCCFPLLQTAAMTSCASTAVVPPVAARVAAMGPFRPTLPAMFPAYPAAHLIHVPHRAGMRKAQW